MNSSKAFFKKYQKAGWAFLSMLALWMWAVPAQAQTSEALSSDFSAMELAVLTLVAITLMVVVLVLMASVSIYNQSVQMLRQKQGITEKEATSFSEWFWKKFNAAKPERAVIMNHEYDGIRELDNDLPPWWKYGFYLSIVLGLIYVYVHANGIAPDSTEEYRAEVQEGVAIKTEYLARMAASINEDNVTLADVAGITKGKQLFVKKCKTCHGENAEGLSGPNLTDKYWIHGGSIRNVYKTIKYGVPAKGMIAWQEQLTPQEMQQVASFILSLQGTNPENAKEPQGELYEEVSE